MHVQADRDAIETDDGQILRHPKSAVQGGLQRADRHHVCHGEDGGDIGALGQQPGRQLVAVLEAVRAAAVQVESSHQPVIARQSGFRQGSLVAAATQHADRGVAQANPQQGDPAVPQAEQVLRHPAGLGEVDDRH